jgi:hypothetical protein
MLYYYLYGAVAVGGAIMASNLHSSNRKDGDGVVLMKAAQRGLRYGLPWPMTLLEIHGKYTKGEDWSAIFRP